MLKEVDWADDYAYRTEAAREPIEFYLNGLCHSNKLDLLLGYFSSAAINVLSLGFATFKVRLIANNVLSLQDKNAIQSGLEHDVKSNLLDLNDIKTLKRSLDEYGQHFFNCLSWLIANDRIEIKIIRPKNRKGIAHYKSGLFHDGRDKVGF
jgi:hypothetical protein